MIEKSQKVRQNDRQKDWQKEGMKKQKPNRQSTIKERREKQTDRQTKNQKERNNSQRKRHYVLNTPTTPHPHPITNITLDRCLFVSWPRVKIWSSSTRSQFKKLLLLRDVLGSSCTQSALKIHPLASNDAHQRGFHGSSRKRFARLSWVSEVSFRSLL